MALMAGSIGGGIEYMWSPNWSVKAEYLHFDFGQENYFLDRLTAATNWNFNHDLTVNSFKVGLNYHFNTVYAPLK